jgi:hypothetical protein
MVSSFTLRVRVARRIARALEIGVRTSHRAFQQLSKGLWLEAAQRGASCSVVLTPLLVQDNTEKGLVDFDFAVVFDEA